MKRILGYTDEISVRPGDRLAAKISCYDVAEYQADVVRLIHGDLNPEGPGFKSEPVAGIPTVRRAGREQRVHSGSHAVVAPTSGAGFTGSFTAQTYIWPTTPGTGEQAILGTMTAEGDAGFELGLDAAGRLQLVLPGGIAVRTESTVLRREWYFVAAVFNEPEHRAELYLEPLSEMLRTRSETTTHDLDPTTVDTRGRPIMMAARDGRDPADGRRAPTRHFNGKIDRPRLSSAVLDRGEMGHLALPEPAFTLGAPVVGAWDFSQNIENDRIHDLSPNRLDGHVVHLPTRAMKGANWSGASMSWKDGPHEYGAIHFHDDDVYDAEWETDFEVEIPSGVRSGVYAIHVRADDTEDYIPFTVRPASDDERSDIVFVLPTTSYLAYANEHMPTDAPLAQLLTDQVVPFQAEDIFLAEHREFGGSTYDTHSDGSGICHSSRLRPILNMRPKYAMWLGGSGSALWQFNADLHITDWLESMGYDFDVITDEDLHREGYDALRPYRVALTGTHAEYVTESMRDAVEAFTHRGGRLVYTSGNGFYWRASYSEHFPGAMEIRKGEGGIRAWAAEPGEYYNSFTGEYSGLWRRSGRPPQQLVGVGFIAQGFDVSGPYNRLPDSHSERASFIFDGIDDDVLGDFGLIGGGAAGLELDHVDPELGTPPHALRLASSAGEHTDIYMVVLEEILINHPGLTGTQSPLVGADLTFFECAGGGAVFATGSIAFCGSLSHNGYQNNISRMVKNVIDRFLDPKPFELPSTEASDR